jgi:Ca2+-binding EF-hand superfamily protein
MTSKIVTRSVLALATAALSISALAGSIQAAEPEARDGRGPGSRMLQRHDADGDGLISLQEFQAASGQMFARLDADGDGRVSAEELATAGLGPGQADREQRAGAGREGAREERAARMQQHRERRFAAMDADGDGQVSRAEFDDAHLERFNAMDANGNGVIDADEAPRRDGSRQGYGKRDGKGDGSRCRSK